MGKINIFIAYSNLDTFIIDEIIKYLRISKDYHELWYYHKTNTNMTMDEIIKKIALMDIFILFLSENSFNSYNVNKEIDAAKNSNLIKEYITVIIDNKVKQISIPNFKTNNIIYVNSSIMAADSINKILYKY